MKTKLLTIVIALLLFTKGFAQTDPLPVKYNIKLRLPLYYNNFFSNWYTVGAQYERLINAKNSLSLGVIYYDFNDYQRLLLWRSVQESKSVLIMPQWRHYFRKNKDNYFNGFYVGASSGFGGGITYGKYVTEKTYFIGIGGLIGYQQVIKKRFSIGFTSALQYGAEYTNLPETSAMRSHLYPVFSGSLDLHIGYIF